jgi:ornithine decarboxylase
VLSLKQIEDNYYFLQTHLPKVKLHYAVKSNPDRAIAERLAALGSCFDVASDGEIDDLSALGVAGGRMLYANPFKTASGLEACARAGVRTFTLDSKSEIEKIARRFPCANVLVRLRLENTAAVVDLNKKFGAPPDAVLPLVRCAAAAGLTVRGLCFHVGSQTLSAAPYLRALHKSRELFELAKREGYDLSVLDMGGGYPVPSLTDDVNTAEFLREINTAAEALFPDAELWAEPGRFISATAVNMLTRVIGVTERNGQPWYFLDEGVYGTFSGVLFDHWDYEFLSFKEGPLRPVTFAGPSCDSLDVIACERPAPALDMDDVLLVPVCGAYSSASATSFNGFARAERVVWEKVRDGMEGFCFAPAV